MFATLSPENRAVPWLRDLGISNAFVSVLCEIEESKLSKALRKLKPLSNEEGLRLITTLNRLIELRDAVLPFVIDTKNPANARALLDAFEGQDAATVRVRVSAIFE
jgi:hypothetical protein